MDGPHRLRAIGGFGRRSLLVLLLLLLATLIGESAALSQRAEASVPLYSPGSTARAGSKTPVVRISRPARNRGATLARIIAPSHARKRLRSPRPARRVSTSTGWSGQQQVLLVLGSATFRGREWVRVLLAERPNGSSGWIPRDHVVLSRTSWWLDVRLRQRRIVVRRAGRATRRFPIVVGTRDTPTPTGLSALYERNRQPDPGGFLGPWSLPLTAHSNVLRDFGGGRGRVAIHGRAGASLRDPLGSARSHGCIRLANKDIAWMVSRIPVGAPVMISR